MTADDTGQPAYVQAVRDAADNLASVVAAYEAGVGADLDAFLDEHWAEHGSPDQVEVEAIRRLLRPGVDWGDR